MDVIALLIFVVGATITPGPNNMLIMGSGFQYGMRKTLPLLLGMCTGFPLLLIAVGVGLSELFVFLPMLYAVVKIAGATYLLYLSWCLFNLRTIEVTGPTERPLGFLQGALFQWVNPKCWVMAISANASFSVFFDNPLIASLVISCAFLFVSIPCVGVWGVAGNIISQHLKDPKKILLFNRLMATLLLVSIVQTLII